MQSSKANREKIVKFKLILIESALVVLILLQNRDHSQLFIESIVIHVFAGFTLIYFYRQSIWQKININKVSSYAKYKFRSSP
jgi:hypothetical protein